MRQASTVTASTGTSGQSPVSRAWIAVARASDAATAQSRPRPPRKQRAWALVVCLCLCLGPNTAREMPAGFGDFDSTPGICT